MRWFRKPGRSPSAVVKPGSAMVYGSSGHDAHIWSKSGNSICRRHFETKKESSNPIFFSLEKTNMCAASSDQPSYTSTMGSAGKLPDNIQTSSRPQKFINVKRNNCLWAYILTVHIWLDFNSLLLCP